MTITPDIARRLVRDQWVRSHGTPRVTVIAGEPALARRLWDAWVGSAQLDREATTFETRDAAALDGALRRAVELATDAPRRPIAVIAPGAVIARWRAGRDDRTTAMVDEGLLTLPADASHARSAGLPLLEARSLAELALFEALEATPATAGRFTLNARLAVRFGPQAAEVDLLSRDDRIAIEIDGFDHFGEPGAYRRDRRKDLLLQGQGLIVVRVLAEDVLRDPRAQVALVCEAIAMRGRP